MSLTKAYFFEEACRFRKIMCDRRNAIDIIQRAFGGLFFVFLNVKPAECDENCKQMLESLMEEWSRRSALMMMHGHPLMAKEGETVFCGD